MVIMMWKKRMEVMRYNAKQPDYHDVMLKQYRTSATSSLSRAMIGWQWVNDVNVVSNYFNKHGLDQKLAMYYNDFADPDDQDHNDNILRVFSVVKSCVEKHIKWSELRPTFIAEVCKFGFVPMAGENGSRVAGSVPQKLNKKDVESTVNQLLSIKLTGSKAVEAMKAHAVPDDDDPPLQLMPEDNEQPDDKKKKKGKQIKVSAKSIGDAKKTAALKSLAKAMLSTSVPFDEMTFGDSITNLVQAAATGANVLPLDEILVLAVPIINITMEFGFCGEVTVGNKMHTKYSELRQAILEQTATKTQRASASQIQNANAQDIDRMLMAATSAGDKSETAAAAVADRPPLGFEQFVKLNFTTSIIKLQPIASELLRTVNEGETFRAEATSNRCHIDVIRSTKFTNCSKQFVNFVSIHNNENNKRIVRVLFSLLCVFDVLIVASFYICQAGAVSDEAGVVQVVTKLVDSVYKPEWVAFANKCVKALATGEDVDARIAALKPPSMPTPEFLERGCALRSGYMRFVLSELADADVVCAPALVSCTKSMCDTLRAIEQKVAAVDAAASNDTRASMWERFLGATDAKGIEAIVDDVASKIRPLDSEQIVPVSAGASPAQLHSGPSPAPSLPSATPAAETRPPTKLDQLYSYHLKFGRGFCFYSCVVFA